MRKIAVLAVVCLMAAPAMAALSVAQDRSNTPIYQAQQGEFRGAGDAIYSHIAMGGTLASVSSPATGGTVSVDDYSTVGGSPTGSTILQEFKFIGGVANAGEVLFFTFFDTAQQFVSSFGTQLGNAGNYVYTITLNTPVEVPNDGFVQMWADDGSVVVASTGTWYMDTAAPTIGTTGDAQPGYEDTASGNFYNHTFEMIAAPEPGTLALLGLGVFALIRRR